MRFLKIFLVSTLIWSLPTVAQSRENIVTMLEEYTRNPGNSAYNHHFLEDMLNPALYDLERIVCQNNDRELFEKFLEMMLKTTDSANETPANVLANIFICRTELVESTLRNKYKKPELIEGLNSGFVNVTSDKKPANYGELQLRLASLSR